MLVGKLHRKNAYKVIALPEVPVSQQAVAFKKFKVADSHDEFESVEFYERVKVIKGILTPKALKVRQEARAKAEKEAQEARDKVAKENKSATPATK